MFVPSGTSNPGSLPTSTVFRGTVFTLLFGIVLLAMLTIVAPPAHVAAAADGYVDTDALNLRETPDLSSSVLAVMWQGEYVAVYDGPYDGGWYQVEYQGQVGWTFGGYLSVGGAPGWAQTSYEDTYDTGWVAERWIDFDRSSQTVTLYEGDVAIASYWGAIGWDTSSDGFFATAIGTYYVYSKYAPISWTDWGQTYISYWVGFDSGRANGFHSYSLDVNGNVLPNGAGATGGCIALDLGAAATVFDFASIGTRVEVHW